VVCFYSALDIRTRNAELKKMAAVLTERTADDRLWPFEKHFPGRIAIAIVDALESGVLPEETIRNQCIAEAVRRRRQKKAPRWDRICWEKVNLFAAFNTCRRRGLRTLAYAMFVVGLTLFIIQGAFRITNTVRQRATLMEVWPPRFVVVSNRPFFDLQAAARELHADVSRHYPPNASGLARILPWHWDVEPLVPPKAEQALEMVDKLRGFGVPVQGVQWDVINAAISSLNVSPDVVSSFRNAELVAQTLPVPSSKWLYLWIVGQPRRLWSTLFSVLAFPVIVPAYVLFMTRRTGRRRRRGNVFSPYWIWLFSPYVIEGSPISDQLWLVFLVQLTLGLFVVLIEVGTKFDFPPNPYMALAKELSPLSAEAITTGSDDENE